MSPSDRQAEFANDLLQTVVVRAKEVGTYFEDALFEIVTEHLVEAGELDEVERAYFDSGRGVRIDGYGGDPRDTDGKLTLIAVDSIQDSTPGNLTQTEMDKAFRRLERFVEEALSRRLLETLDPSSPVWALADLVATRWRETDTLRLLILTNRPLSRRVDRKDAGQLEGVPVTYGVWDLTRLQRFIESGAEREKLEVDFVEAFGRGIPALEANMEEAGYAAYLAVMPAEILAAVYDHWGARLLEQNVRVFLQARSKVNKGIRATLENEPEMFFAFNNGITATAEEVEVQPGTSGLEIVRINNLQIVNGGQTTASIHRASKSEDLQGVFVQMKLAVIDPAEVEEVVPRISRYANSQNRVSEADFFSNHPFHVRIEDFSRRIFAPSPQGEFTQTKWFYERARGQYQDARGDLTPAKRREFDTVNPRRQMFTKTDLAKFLNVWHEKPDTVSKGAQKNFADFAEFVAREWGEHDARPGEGFDERFYRIAIAKAIVFRFTEKLVSGAEWYEGGYRANIVAYSISKLDHEYKKAGLAPDFEEVWKRQGVSGVMERNLYRIGAAVSEVLTNPPEGIANVTEWAKKSLCWERVKALRVPGLELDGDSITRTEVKSREKAAKKDFKVVQGIEAQMFVVNAGDQFWSDLRAWGSEKKVLSAKEVDILGVCARMSSGVLPSEKQSAIAIEALQRLHHEEGCPLGRELLKNSLFS